MIGCLSLELIQADSRSAIPLSAQIRSRLALALGCRAALAACRHGLHFARLSSIMRTYREHTTREMMMKHELIPLNRLFFAIRPSSVGTGHIDRELDRWKLRDADEAQYRLL